jgi:hypothetical protein
MISSWITFAPSELQSLCRDEVERHALSERQHVAGNTLVSMYFYFVCRANFNMYVYGGFL